MASVPRRASIAGPIDLDLALGRAAVHAETLPHPPQGRPGTCLSPQTTLTPECPLHVPSDKRVELKGGMYTFMSLKIGVADVDIVDESLADKVQQAPGFFADTPIVVDLTPLDEDPDTRDALDGSALMACIRKHKLVPMVAATGDKSSPLAKAVEVPLIEGGAARRPTAEDVPKTSAADAANNTRPTNEPVSSSEVEYIIRPPMLIDRPVRSGQQIYARDTDLIIIGQVGPGAEVIADNNIHVYGPLRGRALCGVSGNRSTRIFCQSLEAELVSVAGNYRMLETIPEELRGKPAKIALDNERLNIEPL